MLCSVIWIFNSKIAISDSNYALTLTNIHCFEIFIENIEDHFIHSIFISSISNEFVLKNILELDLAVYQNRSHLSNEQMFVSAFLSLLPMSRFEQNNERTFGLSRRNVSIYCEVYFWRKKCNLNAFNERLFLMSGCKTIISAQKKFQSLL